MFHKYFTMYFNYNIYRFSKHTVAYLSFQRDIIVQLRSTILAPCLNEHIYRLLVIVQIDLSRRRKLLRGKIKRRGRKKPLIFIEQTYFSLPYLKGKISNLHYVYFYEYVAIYRKTKNDVEQHLEIEALLRLVKKITRLKRRY